MSNDKDARTLLEALLDTDAADALGEDAAWTGLLARAGRAHLESGLAHGEFRDGLHAEEGAAIEGVQRLAAATSTWPLTYGAYPWQLRVELHPNAGVYLWLDGPADATLRLTDTTVPLPRRRWTPIGVGIGTFTNELVLLLSDGRSVTLALETS